jgi:hypothetical protein
MISQQSPLKALKHTKSVRRPVNKRNAFSHHSKQIKYKHEILQVILQIKLN